MEKVQDLYLEHELHTSEDWENLQDRCSECFKIMQSRGRGRKFAEHSANSGRLEDEHFTNLTNRHE